MDTKINWKILKEKLIWKVTINFSIKSLKAQYLKEATTLWEIQSNQQDSKLFISKQVTKVVVTDGSVNNENILKFQ